MSVFKAVVVLTCRLLIACGAIFAVDRLQAESTKARDAELQLVNLRLQLSQVQDVPWGAAPEEGDNVDDVRNELQDFQDGITGSLDELSRNGGLPERQEIIAPFNRSMKNLWTILELVSKGRGDETGKASSLAAHQVAKADEALQK